MRSLLLLLSLPFVPFTLAIGLLACLLVLELAALLMGGSILGAEDGGPDIEPDLAALVDNFDLDAGVMPDIDSLLTASDQLHDFHASPHLPAGGLLGLGHTPLMIWLAALLLGFGLGGLALQAALVALTGTPLPVWTALPIALFAGLVFARVFSRSLASLVPSIETTATSIQFMGGLRGVVSQGIARRGAAAEVKLHDRHGNIHYLRLEPFDDDDVIAEGSTVLTVRQRLAPGSWTLRILSLD